MQLSLPKEVLQTYISAQINNLFPDNDLVNLNEYNSSFNTAIDRIDFSFKKVSHSRYNNGDQTILNHLYADQYLIFIWFLSNTIWKEKGHIPLCNKLYYLNKALHGFDCMYDTNLPDVFLVFHGTGTMLGKANYNDYLVVFQGCTVGAHHGKYPKIGKGVTLTAHTSVVGDCTLGDRSTLSINTSIFKKDIPADTIVYIDRLNGRQIIKNSDIAFAQQFFNINIYN